MVCVLLAAQTQSPLERAVALARDRRYNEADQLLQDVPEPTALDQRIAFHRLRAAIASGLNRRSAAATEMQAALALRPEDPSLRLAAAVAELQSGELDIALQHASAADNTANAKAVIADIQEKRGAYSEAEAAYRAAVQLDPTAEKYPNALAFYLIRHQKFLPAIEAIGSALTLFPKSAGLLTLLGIAQYAGADIEAATASLSKAIFVDQHAEPAHRILSQIVLESSAAPSPLIADQLCRWNLTVCNALKLRAARANQDSSLESKAIAGLVSAPASDIVARCELARAWDWSDRLSDARKEMEQCVAANPTPQNHYRLGRIYQRLGLPVLAQAQMDLRNRLLAQMSEQTFNGMSALRALQ